MQLRVGEQALRLFSTVTTLGTPLDVAASELAIETFLPADTATRRWLAEADSWCHAATGWGQADGRGTPYAPQHLTP
jgi:hypothetical protein